MNFFDFEWVQVTGQILTTTAYKRYFKSKGSTPGISRCWWKSCKAESTTGVCVKDVETSLSLPPTFCSLVRITSLLAPRSPFAMASLSLSPSHIVSATEDLRRMESLREPSFTLLRGVDTLPQSPSSAIFLQHHIGQIDYRFSNQLFLSHYTNYSQVILRAFMEWLFSF